MNERQHVEIAREQRVCGKHGNYDAILWDLRPKPAGYPNLPGMGIAADFLQPFWSKCPTCDGELQREVDAKDAAIRTGQTEAQKLLAMKLAEAGIPARYQECSVFTWQHPMDQQKREWSWARDYITGFDIALQTGRSAAICGAPGTGKTSLAIGILRHVLNRGGTGRYVTVMKLLEAIKASYRKDSDMSEQEAKAQFTTVDLLVVDEVGRELENGYSTAQLFSVLDERYGNLRPTLLVSNLSRPKLLAFLGDAVVDRIREAGGAIRSFEWASQRNRRVDSDDTTE